MPTRMLPPAPPVSRRRFLGALAAALPLAVIARRAHTAALVHLRTDPATLHALAETILPSELGAAGISAAATAFLDWGANYHEGAELVHGYGTSRLRATGPTPVTRWSRQLDDLDTAAQTKHQHAFRELPIAERTALVRAAIANDSTNGPERGPGEALRPDRMPGVAEAHYIALGLLAHFYESSAAADLCYGVHIGRQTCRPLAAQSTKPSPLLKVTER
jgi:hypothetical protein